MPSNDTDAKAWFAAALNSSGYGFQYAVLRRANELFEARQSSWLFEVAEFPVSSEPREGRIDFVLRRETWQRFGARSPFYLVGECKRANPALARWLFARAPYTRRNAIADCTFVERSTFGPNGSYGSVGRPRFYSASAPYHVALEARTNVKGDPASSGRGAVEEAVTQALRGMNGLAQYFAQHRDLCVPEANFVDLLPVVFTTASIWTSEADLGASELETGNIVLEEGGVKQSPWIIYQYNQSRSFRLAEIASPASTWIGEALEADSTRSVAIVSAGGIESFLTWASAIDIY